MSGTRILRIALGEAVAKIRNWGVEDSEEDMNIPVWAGVIPLETCAMEPIAEAGCAKFPAPALPLALQRQAKP